MTNSTPNPNPAPNPGSVPATRVGYGVRAAPSGLHRPRPAFDTAALIEAIHMQLRTWVTDAYRVEVPEPGTVTTATELSSFISRVTRAAMNEPENRATWTGMAHLFHADANASHAAERSGDAYLLGALYSLIGARALLHANYPGALPMSPFPEHEPTLNEAALIEAIRVQALIFVRKPSVSIPERWEMRGAADLSDFIARVADAAETRYGNMADADSSRGLEHVVNARAHALRAAYCHGDAHLFAALRSLTFAAANLRTI